MIQTTHPPSNNPFLSQGEYSSAAVDLMRAMSSARRDTGAALSSPEQVLAVLRGLGYSRPATQQLGESAEARLFTHAVARFLKQNDVLHPTCEDVLSIAADLGYRRSEVELRDTEQRLPIDRRRHELDTRLDLTERRASSELSPQEQLDLTDEEHQLLDQLKALRERTQRDFASSEELLSIIWELGYRPEDENECLSTSLTQDERCRVQVAFTRLVERQLEQNADHEFLTCRDLLKIVGHLGFRRA